MRRNAIVWTVLIVGGVVLAIAIFWPFSDLVANHDINGIPAAERGGQVLTAVDSAREQLFQVCAGVLAALGFYYTARGFLLNKEQSELNRQTLKLSVEGQMTERFSRAVDQIGSTRIEVRVGGIYALERLAADSTHEHDKSVVIDVISAFLLSHARSPGRNASLSNHADVSAAMTVIARRDRSGDADRISLPGIVLKELRLAPGAYLANIDFTGAIFSGSDLAGADFTNAILDDADLSGTNLHDAVLADVRLKGTRLNKAILNGVKLRGADLSGADLRGATMAEANLKEACLDGSELTGNDLTDADLSGARLAGADLTGATLIGANLKDARADGIKLSKARLNRADLTGAVLSNAQLTETNFSEAVCAQCTFSGAKAYDAKFWQTDLSGVDLEVLAASGALLDGAFVEENAVLPAGWLRQSQTGQLVRRKVDRA